MLGYEDETGDGLDEIEMKAAGDFVGNKVLEWNPLTFSVEFIKRMRAANDKLLNIPSTRQAIAIPKFLFARYYRTLRLLHEDFIMAAVFTTPVEDQDIARQIACEILFPTPPTFVRMPGMKGTAANPKVKNQILGMNASRGKRTKDDSQGKNALDDLLSEMEELGLSFDNIDTTDFLEQGINELQKLSQFLDDFYSKAARGEEPYKSMVDFLERRNGIYDLMAKSTTSMPDALDQVRSMVQRDMNVLTPGDIKAAANLGFAQMIAQGSQIPWIQAGAEYLNSPDQFMQNMKATQQQQDVATAARTIRYLLDLGLSCDALNSQLNDLIQRFNDLNGMLELSRLMGNVPPFDKQDIFGKSLAKDVNLSFQAARTIDDEFGRPISNELFDQWLKANPNPSLEDAFRTQVNGDAWNGMLDEIVANMIKNERGDPGALQKLADLADHLQRMSGSCTVANAFEQFTFQASRAASEAMHAATTPDQFLSTLNNIVNANIEIATNDVVDAGRALNIPSDVIEEILGGSYPLLKKRIEECTGNYNRYERVMNKLGSFTIEQTKELMESALLSGNQQALGALGLHDLGEAMKAARQIGPDAIQNLSASLSAGPGENLLKEWFSHRRNIPKEAKDVIRKLTRAALLRIAMQILAKQRGVGENGLIPTSRLRVFREGDELDLIDIDATIENLVMAGKGPDQLAVDDVLVQDTQKGRIAFTFLIDISGSMSGQKLASCAISVVILIGKLSAEEVAVALFESNTHVIKTFKEEKDIEGVVDELLDLHATGGTRVMAALEWASDQLKDNVAEKKLCMILTDCCFSEEFDQIKPCLDKFNVMKTNFIVAVDAHYSQSMLQSMVDHTRGEIIKFKRVKDIPKILSETLDKIQ